MGRNIFGEGDEEMHQLRCRQCNKLLAEHIEPPFRIRCPRCKTMNGSNGKKPVDLPTERL